MSLKVRGEYLIRSWFSTQDMHTNQTFFLLMLAFALTVGSPPISKAEVSESERLLSDIPTATITLSENTLNPTEMNILNRKAQIRQLSNPILPPTPKGDHGGFAHEAAEYRNTTQVAEHQLTLATLVEQGLVQTQLLQRTFHVIQEYLPTS